MEQPCRKAVWAAVAGNLLEWYDFVIYSFLAVHIARVFFPSGGETAGLLAAYATFGTGFAARPLGAIALGWIGDRHGRKTGMVVSFALMAAATLAIGLLPGHASAGLLAPILLILARLVQGFSVGGEWGNSAVFIVEWAPDGRRGFLSSLQQCSVIAGLLLGSGLVALLNTFLTSSAMDDWGWRMPFLLGALIAPIGLYIRWNTDETPAYRQTATAKAWPETGPAPRLVPLLQGCGIMVLSAAQFYIFFAYLPSHMQRHGGLSSAEALWITTAALAATMVFTPLCGYLSDRIGRKPLLFASCAAFIVLPYPVFGSLQSGAVSNRVAALQLLVAAAVALYSGALPSVLSEIFATRNRTTDLSIANAAAVTVFGGFAPYIATWLTVRTGSSVSPAYYVVACALLSGFAVLSLRETAHSKLR